MKEEQSLFPPLGSKLRFTTANFYSTSEERGAIVTVISVGKDGFKTNTNDGWGAWVFDLPGDGWKDGLEIYEEPPARQEGETLEDQRFLIISSDLTCIEGSQEGWPTEESQIALRSIREELSAKQAEVERLTTKVENQRERIVCLEGATNHACGTPLSLEKSKNDKLRSELESLKAEQGWIRNNCTVIYWPHPDNPIGTYPIEHNTHHGTKKDCWDMIMSQMPLPTPPVERSVDGE